MLVGDNNHDPIANIHHPLKDFPLCALMSNLLKPLFCSRRREQYLLQGLYIKRDDFLIFFPYDDFPYKHMSYSHYEETLGHRPLRVPNKATWSFSS